MPTAKVTEHAPASAHSQAQSPTPGPNTLTTNGTLQDQVRNYVQLERAAQRYRDAGQAIPPQLRHALQEGLNTFRASSPSVQRVMSRLVDDERIVQSQADRIHSQMDTMARQLRQRNKQIAKHFPDFAGSGKPMTREQFDDIARGKAKVKIPTGRARFDAEKMRKALLPFAAKLGLRKDASWKTIERRLDDLVDGRYKVRAGEKAPEDMLTGVDIQPDELNEALDYWEEHSLGMAFAERLNKRDNENKVPFEEEIDVDDSLRAKVRAAMPMVTAATDAAAEWDGYDEVTQDISEDYLEDETMRGDIARAWVKVDAGEGYADREARGEAGVNPFKGG